MLNKIETESALCMVYRIGKHPIYAIPIIL